MPDVVRQVWGYGRKMAGSWSVDCKVITLVVGRFLLEWAFFDNMRFEFVNRALEWGVSI